MARNSIFEFENISYVVGNSRKKKHILKNINGQFSDGSMVAIMGPSGAGKTCLLKALSLGITSGTVYGSIKLNGNDLTNEVFKEHCFLVEQDDHHWPFLTAKETLTYAAELILGPGEHTKIVETIIEKMGLISCQNFKVGNDFMQGLSGGQKRRLSVGIALLKKPAVIMLDEPTSGLDAAGAVAIVNELKTLAKSEKLIIISTIHQPSTKVYNHFDLVMLLSKGQQAYMGKARRAQEYFASIGHPMVEMTNPAEYLLDLVNADFTSDESVNDILNHWQHFSDKMGCELQGSGFANRKDSPHGLAHGQRRRSPFHDLSTLFRRHALMIGRDPFLYFGRSITILVACILFALAYWNSRDRIQDQAINYSYANLSYVAVGSLLAVIAVYVLNAEFKSVYREVKNGMMHPLAYIFAKSVLVLPVMFLFGISAISASSYGILGMQTNYVIYLIMYAISMFCFECLAELFSVISYGPLPGMLQFLAFWFASYLFSGLFLPCKDLPIAVRWLYYVLPFANAFSAVAYNSVVDENWENCFSKSQNSSPICVDFSAPPNDEEKPGVLMLDSINRLLPFISSEDKRIEQMGTLLVIALTAKCIYIGIILFKSSRATKLCRLQKDENDDTSMSRDSSTDPASAEVNLVGFDV